MSNRVQRDTALGLLVVRPDVPIEIALQSLNRMSDEQMRNDAIAIVARRDDMPVGIVLKLTIASPT